MIQCEHENCERTFDSQKGASIHYTAKHAKTGTIKCNYKCCGKQKKFNRSDLPNQHQKELSKDAEEIDLEVCRECQKKGGKFGANYQGGKVSVECNFCGNAVEMWPCRKERIGEELEFCQRCRPEYYSKNFSKQQHPRWNGGDKKYGENWSEMRNKARKEYGDVCQNCGKGWDELKRRPSIHHINPIREYNKPEDANEMNNLIQLCSSCHGKIENEKDSVEQMEIFDKNYLVITGDVNA